MPTKHVLMYVSWYPTEKAPYGGIFFWEYAKALEKRGIDVTMLYTSRTKGFTNCKVKDVNGIKTIIVNVSKVSKLVKFFRWRIVARKVARIIRGNKPDIIHCQSGDGTTDAIAQISKKLGVPYIYTEHSTGFYEKIYSKKKLEQIARAYAKSKGVYAVSSFLMSYIKDYIPNGMDTKIIPNSPSDIFFAPVKPLRKQSKQEFTFAFLGNLVPQKNVDVLMRAFKILVDNGRNVALTIGGHGYLRENFEKLANELNLTEKIKFVGSVTKDVSLFYDNCDCFVLPSFVETFGIVTLESLARGRPVVVSDVGASRDLVNDKNGYIVKVGDVEDLASKMALIMDNYNKYNASAIQNGVKNYTYDSQVDEYLKIYEKCTY